MPRERLRVIEGPCPECGARLRAPRDGAVVACTQCASPVAVHVSREPASRERVSREREATRVTPPSVAPGPSRGLPAEAKTAIALALLALLHVGVYVLLTGSARSRVAADLAAHGAKLSEEAVDPGPANGEVDYDAWRDREAFYQRQLRHHRDQQHIAVVHYACLASFVIQAGLIGVALAGFRRRRRRSARR